MPDELTDEAKQAIADAVRQVRDDRLWKAVHKLGGGDDDPKPPPAKDPPPPKAEPVGEPKKGVWWP